jgi:hypothetical protein
MKLLAGLLLIALSLSPNPSAGRFENYRLSSFYDAGEGVRIVPIYSSTGAVCAINIERSHLYNGSVDVNPGLTKAQILSLFDALVPSTERGGPGWKLPLGTEVTEVDGGTRATQIVYEKVSLVMYGSEHDPKYGFAAISWKGVECPAM